MLDTKVVVGVTGGIAAYKTVELVRLLIKSGAEVKVIMTESAKKFIHPNTFKAISGNSVYDSLFDDISDPMSHITLAKWAEYFIIAPATASFCAKLAHGICDDLLLTTLIATEAHVLIAPAMNKVMWQNRQTEENILKLRLLDYQIIEPQSGEQACGDIGMGRMAEPEIIYDYFEKNVKGLTKLINTSIWKDKKIVITAGPTQEAIDPVRFISNHSSGKMGYALAEVFNQLGAKVTLISGPTKIKVPAVEKLVSVCSANEMYQEVMQNINACELFIGAAAVSDYRIKNPSEHKIKKEKNERGENSLILEFIENPDIIASVGHLRESRPFVVAFAAETDNLIENAKAKCLRKNADIIIANQVESTGAPFYQDFNSVIVLNKEAKIALYDSQSKRALAF